FTGEVPQVEDLPLSGRGSGKAGNSRIDPAVQNADQDTAAIVGGIRFAKLDHSRGGEWHPAFGKRLAGRQNRLGGTGRVGLDRGRRCYGGRIGTLCRLLRSVGAGK